MFDVQFYLFCSIACFRPVDRQVERKPLENFRDINRLVVVPASDPKDLFVEHVTMQTMQSIGLIWVGLVK
jgi:hypothetical protein